MGVASSIVFLTVYSICWALRWISMIKKTAVLTESNLLVDLTLHKLPASLLSEFAEKIVRPYYRGNMNA